MTEVLLFGLVLVVCVVAIYVVCAVIDFIAGVPRQLKRIADALEWRNKNGK